MNNSDRRKRIGLVFLLLGGYVGIPVVCCWWVHIFYAPRIGGYDFLLVRNESSTRYEVTVLPVSQSGVPLVSAKRTIVSPPVVPGKRSFASPPAQFVDCQVSLLSPFDFRDVHLIVWVASLDSRNKSGPKLLDLYYPEMQPYLEGDMSGIRYPWGELVLKEDNAMSFARGNSPSAMVVNPELATRWPHPLPPIESDATK